MKKISTMLVLFFLAVAAFAQSGSKVQWAFVSKKISDKKYEVKITATIQSGWHMYSQNQSADAIVLPTKVTFAKNPLLVISGKPKEVGKLYDQFDKAIQARSKYYSNKVEFIQMVTIKSTVNTSVVGEVEFMVCDDKQCLPPDRAKFSIKL